MADNDLEGTIPPELGILTDLRTLDLNGNDLTGNIPQELANLPNLETLDLGNNQLTGEIPSSIGSPWSLRNINLEGNPFTGCVPLLLVSRLDASSANYGDLDLCPNPQREPLIAFYHATGGPNWTNNSGWLTDAPGMEYVQTRKEMS